MTQAKPDEALPGAPRGAFDGRKVRLTRQLVGLDCADCALTLERAIGMMDGVDDARLDFATGRLDVTLASSPAAAEDIDAVVAAAGYGIRGPQGGTEPARWRLFVRQRRDILTLAATAALAAGWLTTVARADPRVTALLFACATVLAGFGVARSGAMAIRANRALDMNVLMSVAAVGAMAIGEWAEAATAMVLFGIGNMLEGYTADRARSAIRNLMDLTPAVAIVRDGSREISVAVADLEPGQVVIVRAGTRIPVDGLVIGGVSTVDESPLTGESMPVEKAAADPVFAGTLNGAGVLEVRATSRPDETVMSRIVHLVETAQANRAPSQRFVDRFARVYTPVVIGLAGFIGIGIPLVTGEPVSVWFYRALVLLVIACPCALVLSTPVTIASAIASAARRGILVKGGAHLEAIAGVDTAAIDKTGTLTLGQPFVTDVVPLDGNDTGAILALAAAVERQSEHPLGRVIAHEARHRSYVVPPASSFEALPGRGARALVHGRWITVGSRRALDGGSRLERAADNAVAQLEEQGKTAVVVAADGRAIGVVGLADGVRPTAAGAIRGLRAAGVTHVVMLTGDNPATARAIGEVLGLDEIRAGLLPADKADAVVALTNAGATVAMIGDGINDAPALAAAAVGVAMADAGAIGSDATLETADIVLLGGDLRKLAYSVRLGHAARRTVMANIAVSLAVKAAFMALAVAGLTSLWMAVLSDVGTSVLVVLNGMRLLRFEGGRGTDGSDPP